MKKKFLTPLVICSAALVSIPLFFLVTGFETKEFTIDGCVGDGSTDGCVKGALYTPEAIVMEGKLLVFYKLEKKEETFFYPATANTDGTLKWLINDIFYHEPFDAYPIDPVAFKTTRFSPTPILFDNKLYLFGRQDDPERIIYNSVDNYNDLINDFWNRTSPHEHNSSLGQTIPDNDKDQISLVNFKDPWTTDSINKLLMVFYWKNKGPYPYYSTCTPHTQSTSGELHCDVSTVLQDYDPYKYDSAPHLANEKKYAFNQWYTESTLYIRRTDTPDSTNKTLDSFRLNNEIDGWFGNDGPGFKPSAKPLGSAQQYNSANNTYTTIIYYIEKDKDKIYKAVGGGENWTITDTGRLANAGVKVIPYNGRIYVFYRDKKDNVMKYFSDELTTINE